MNKIFLILLLYISITTLLFGRTCVWKVSSEDKVLYIGGTIHLLRPQDFPLPKEFDKAYAQSSYLVFETDMEAIEKPEFLAMLLSKTLLPQGKSLSSLLSKPTNEKLRAYLKQEKLSIELFDHLQPWAVVMTLTQAKLLGMGMSENGVDSYYASQARQEGKKSCFLETPEEQIDVISKIGEGEEDAMIRQSLRELDEMPSQVDDLLAVWKRGDTVQLERDLLTPLKNDSPLTYRILVKKRNDAWMQVLSKMLSQKQSAFVLVGTLHLVGEDGLLERFRKLGFQVEAVE